MHKIESTWNRFNDVKEKSKTATSEDERKVLYKLLSELQSLAEQNYTHARNVSSDLQALERLRSNEKYLTDKLLQVEESRRYTRTVFIILLVIVNAIQMSYIFSILLKARL